MKIPSLSSAIRNPPEGKRISMITNVWRKTHIAEILLVLENRQKFEDEDEDENEDDLKNASYRSF